MRYLGGISGDGTISCGGKEIARAAYDFDGYLAKPGHVTGNGEIRLPPEALRTIFGRGNVKLLTDDGRTLSLRFSEKQLREASDCAHVDISGDVPSAAEWQH